MVGLFDLFPFIVAGACVGAVWLHGIIWRLSAAPLGWVLGRLIVNVLGYFIDAQAKKELRSLSLDNLQTRFKDPKCFQMDNILLEIKARGENIAQYRAYLFGLLVDESTQRRCWAYRAIRVNFPDDVDRIKAYRPLESVEVCRRKSEILRAE